MNGMHKITLRSTLITFLLSLLLTSCTAGPDYIKPEINLPASYKESGRWQTAQPDDESPRGPWWTIFADQELDRLMGILDQQNFAIEQAEAQFRQSQALLREARAGLMPTLAPTASASHGVLTPGAGTGNQYSLGVSASWEVDLWGSVRREIEAGVAKQAASASQVAAIRLSSQAQLASAYLQLRIADRQLDSLQASEETLRQTLTITKNQYAAGIISQSSVVLAESQLKAAQALRVQKLLARKQLEHAIAVALGLTPADFSLPPMTDMPRLPQIPAGLPSTLLQRRPDIAIAERNMAVANAQIGVATAAYFPVLTLSASGAYRSSSFLDWINVPNRIWSLGPQLAGTLFDGGLRRAQTDSAIAAYDASVAGYRQTVLDALQTVEDNLAAQHLLAEEAELQQAAVDAAIRAEHIALNQYRAGTIGYLGVLTAQNSRIATENTLWNIKNNQYTSSIALINGIGGSW